MLRARRAKGPSWPSAPRSHKELDVQKARVKTSHSARSFCAMARRFGYSRVSTSDQDWSLQLEALTKVGVDDRDIFRGKASGAKRDRTELRRMLDQLRPGIRPPSTAWTASPGPSFTSCKSWRRSRARAQSSCL